jgi:hypothetical protein
VMRAARRRGILGARPGRPGARSPPERSPPMRTLRTAAAYARFLLSSLAAVAFGTNLH